MRSHRKRGSPGPRPTGPLAELMRAASGTAATWGRSRRADASAVPTIRREYVAFLRTLQRRERTRNAPHDAPGTASTYTCCVGANGSWLERSNPRRKRMDSNAGHASMRDCDDDPDRMRRIVLGAIVGLYLLGLGGLVGTLIERIRFDYRRDAVVARYDGLLRARNAMRMILERQIAHGALPTSTEADRVDVQD